MPGLDESLRRQVFARIIFVNDITNYTRKYEDHEPLKEKPAFGSLVSSKIVSELKKIFFYSITFERVKLFRIISDVEQSSDRLHRTKTNLCCFPKAQRIFEFD